VLSRHSAICPLISVSASRQCWCGQPSVAEGDPAIAEDVRAAGPFTLRSKFASAEPSRINRGVCRPGANGALPSR
jgi:hypothetical protein